MQYTHFSNSNRRSGGGRSLHRISRLTIVAVGLSAAAVSCGSSSSGLSADQFKVQADAICQQVRDYSDKVAPPTDLKDEAKKLQQILDISKTGVSSMTALTLTGALKTSRDNIVSAATASQAHLTSAIAAAKNNDEAKVNQELASYNDDPTKLQAVSKAAGLTKCAGDDPTATTTAANTTNAAATSAPTTAAATTTAATTTAATTAAPRTTAPVRTTPVTTAATAPSTGPVAPAFTIPEATTASGVPFVDPATLLTPWDGQKLVPFTDADAQSLVSAITSTGGVSQYLAAIGAVQAVDATTGKLSVLIFMELKAPLSDADTNAFYQSLLEGTSNQEQGTVAGSTGYAFTTSDEEEGFATIRNTTVILGESSDQATLAATIGGLFQANPQL